MGGGLAGMACAAALVGRGLHVELFEGRKKLGGRAGSYLDRESGESIDHCQHVAMGCCTNFLDFCRRTQIDTLFTQQKTLHFFGPDGQRCDFTAGGWWPAPLHLMGPLMGLKYLTLSDKASIAKGMLSLVRSPAGDVAGGATVGDWLRQQKQSERAIERFWKVVLVSALAESLERASLAAARKVFVDGFLAHRDAADLWIPKVSLDELYQGSVRKWLVEQGVRVHLESSIAGLVGNRNGIESLRLADESTAEFDNIVLAVPWMRVAKLLPKDLQDVIDPEQNIGTIGAAPISSVHLWFDRAIMNLPNAILVERLSQWVFARSFAENRQEHYYQVVISASHDLAGRERGPIVEEVRRDLCLMFPATAEAKLLRSKVITDDQAVFAVTPGLELRRPAQRTMVGNLFLAGDWTNTGWPATMEGAVRSGYLAAEGVLERLGRPEMFVRPDLKRNWLTQWL